MRWVYRPAIGACVHSFARLLVSSVIAVSFVACGSAEQGDDAPVISHGCDNDGVIDTGEECDEGSNNGQPGFCCSSSCTLVSAGTLCRAATGSCDAAESCDGTSAACPVDAYLGTEIVCRPAAGDCDVAERCTGASISCPTDGYASEHHPASACAPYVCSGSSPACPTSSAGEDDCSAGHTCSGSTCSGSTTGPGTGISDPPPPSTGSVHSVALPSGYSWERIAHEPTIGLTQSIIDAHENDADSRVNASYGDAKYSWRRFEVVTASSEAIAPPPGGGASVLRHEPHAANSSLYPISYDIDLAPGVQASNYSAALFRFGHYAKEYWGASGKFIAACIGRGWGGTAFLKSSSSTWGNDGHATYLMHPQTNKTGTTSDNAYGGFTQYYEAYHRSPADLYGDSTSGRSDTWALNAWNTLDILLAWENGQTGQDSVAIFYNGTQVSSKTGITLPIVTGDHSNMKGFFYRIRMEDELSPEDGQENKNFKEYWADAELFLAP